MNYSSPDSELEAELQEIYLQASHWLNDISFLETETQFFRNVIDRYPSAPGADMRSDEFKAKIEAQYQRLESLKAKIPNFLSFVEPFIGDLKKPMDMDFLNRYNTLHLELISLFNSYRLTKSELFQYTESLMAPKNPA
ncbi:hypothetical protein ACFS5N_10680 [Mucilaginibacter ximonensis]|uniref:Uncharacterized protein n=1 Tax=Mucilaginibacter ximonensis TaxID=538021 RepID=A0ABW5YCM9_9SPHI